MKKFNCAVIGCGRIGCGFDENQNKRILTHAGSYFNNNKTNLVALCDIDIKKLKKYGKKYSIKNLYTDSTKMFNSEKLDCISICTLADSHLDLVIQAAKYNIKGIFLEKPISSSLHQAKKIIEICKKNKISLIIDHQRRFDPLYNQIKLLIQQKKIGKIQRVNTYYGSGIANTGSHLFDLLRMLFGEVLSIKANFSNNISNNLQDSNLDIDLKFSHNVECIIQALDYRNFALFEMDIIGTSGRIKLDLVSNQAEFFMISEKNSLVYKKLQPKKILTKISKYSLIELGVKNLIDSLMTKTNSPSTGLDGYKSLELIVASLTSAKTGKSIKLPIPINNYKIGSK